MSDRYVKKDDNKKILYIDANNLYGHSTSQPLAYDELQFDKNGKLEDIRNTPDDSDIGYFVEIDLTYPDNIKKKTKNIPFAPENEKRNSDNFRDCMKKLNLILIHKLKTWSVTGLMKKIVWFIMGC